MVTPADRARIARAFARLQAELGAELVGVLATGSRIRGRADATSDLDLEVIIASSFAGRG